MSITGTCHCGAVQFVLPRRPEKLTDCNCSICRRLAPLWGYYLRSEVTIKAAPDATIAYCWGDKPLEFHTCKACGCTTHWQGVAASPSGRMAFNFRLVEPTIWKNIRIRRFDGADTWEFLD